MLLWLILSTRRCQQKQTGGKWDLRSLKLHLICRVGKEATDRLFQEMQGIIVRSLLAVQKIMINDKHCFELYGYDLIFDDELTPWLLEVNASPSLSANTAEDYDLKFKLLNDVLDVVDVEGRCVCVVPSLCRDVRKRRKRLCSSVLSTQGCTPCAAHVLTPRTLRRLDIDCTPITRGCRGRCSTTGREEKIGGFDLVYSGGPVGPERPGTYSTFLGADFDKRLNVFKPRTGTPSKPKPATAGGGTARRAGGGGGGSGGGGGGGSGAGSSGGSGRVATARSPGGRRPASGRTGAAGSGAGGARGSASSRPSSSGGDSSRR